MSKNEVMEKIKIPDERAFVSFQLLQNFMPKVKKQGKTIYQTLINENQVKVKLSPTCKKIAIAKDQIKDNAAFHIILLAMAQVSKISLKIQDSKYEKKQKLKDRDEKFKLIEPHEKFEKFVQEQVVKPFQKLQKLQISITCTTQPYISTALNLVASIMKVLLSFEQFLSLHSLSLDIANNKQLDAQKQIFLCILEMIKNGKTSLKRLQIPYIPFEISQQIKYPKVQYLQLLQCDENINDERLFVFLQKFERLKRLSLKLKKEVFYTKFNELSQILGHKLQLLETFSLNNLQEGNYQEALKNILQNCAYLGNFSLNIQNPSKNQESLKRLINSRLSYIQQQFHMLKILQKEGFDYSSCMGIMNRIKPFIL